jgi:hypothetical protein
MKADPTNAEILAAVAALTPRFDAVDARLDKVDARLDKVDARLDKIEGRLSEVEGWQKNQPDMRLMLANSKVVLEKLIHIDSEITMLRSAVNDHARENVTPGEVAAIHYELANMRRELMDGEARMRRVESVLELPRV